MQMKTLVSFISACVIAGCSDLGFEIGSLTDLERAQARWERTRPEAYSFAVERICYCLVEWTGPVRLLVEGDSVTARTYVASGEPVPAPVAHFFPQVDSLFGILRSAYVQDAHDVRVTYHPTFGFPAEFFIDYDQLTADEELGMRVTEQPVSARFDVSAPTAR
jgi:hypothetical protein